MNRFWSGLWAMFTNNGMYSTVETIVVLVISTAAVIAIMAYVGWKAERDQRIEMMATLTPRQYQDYLQWKALLEETHRRK